MAQAMTHSGNGIPTRTFGGVSDARRERLTQAVQEKLEQGFAVESESDTQAVLIVKGRRRWFGLQNAPSVRYEVTVDEGGHPRSRRL